jgi:hypothetical protein
LKFSIVEASFRINWEDIVFLKPLVALVALFLSGAAIAAEYQSFSYVDYTRVDIGSVDEDGWILATTYYLDERATLGPLDEFTYINPISRFGIGYASFGDNDTLLFNGEYFFHKVVVGAEATSEDGIDQAWLGYLFSHNFLVRVDAVDEFDDTELYFSARYRWQLRGTDYLGFSARIDDDLNDLSLSAKYLRSLRGGRYFSIGASIVDTTMDSYATLDGRYFWNERTSVNAGLRNDSGFLLGVKHFFNTNFWLRFEYEENDNIEAVGLRIGAQF